MDLQTAVVLRLDRRGGTLKIAEFASERDDVLDGPFAAGEGVVAGAVRHGRSVNLDRVDPSYRGLPYYAWHTAPPASCSSSPSPKARPPAAPGGAPDASEGRDRQRKRPRGRASDGTDRDRIEKLCVAWPDLLLRRSASSVDPRTCGSRVRGGEPAGPRRSVPQSQMRPE